MSQKAPFDILDFTPSVALLANTGGHDWLLIPALLYTGIKNVALRVRMALNRGNPGSEYGERAVKSRVHLRAPVFLPGAACLTGRRRAGLRRGG